MEQPVNEQQYWARRAELDQLAHGILVTEMHKYFLQKGALDAFNALKCNMSSDPMGLEYVVQSPLPVGAMFEGKGNTPMEAILQFYHLLMTH